MFMHKINIWEGDFLGGVRMKIVAIKLPKFQKKRKKEEKDKKKKKKVRQSLLICLSDMHMSHSSNCLFMFFCPDFSCFF